MEIEQYLQAALAEKKDPQSYFGEEVEVNSQEAILATHSDDVMLGVFKSEEKTFPAEISLMVTAVFEALGDIMPHYKMIFMSKSSPCDPLILSQMSGGLPNLCCSRVDLQWYGEGSQRGEYGTVEDLSDHLAVFPQGVIHRKHFNLPPGTEFVCQETYEKGRWGFNCEYWHASRVNERPLIPFGGFMEPTLDPESVGPLYAKVGGAQGTTALVKSHAFWRAQGVSPGVRGHYEGQFLSLIDLPQPYVVTSLAQDIRGGRVRIEHDGVAYTSHSYDVIDPTTQKLLIHFKQT